MARLVGTEYGRIVHETSRLLTDATPHAAMTKRLKSYGDGKAASRIVAALLEQVGPR